MTPRDPSDLVMFSSIAVCEWETKIRALSIKRFALMVVHLMSDERLSF